MIIKHLSSDSVQCEICGNKNIHKNGHSFVSNMKLYMTKQQNADDAIVACFVVPDAGIMGERII